MNIKPVSALLAIILIGTGCSSMKVNTEQAKEYDFSTIQTYQWVPGPAEILDEEDTYINKDIELALGNELQKAGLQEAALDSSSDVHMAYYVKLKEQLEYTDTGARSEREFSGGFVYNRDDKNWNYQEREPDLNVYTVEIGTLTVLAYDAKSGKRVWRGTLRTTLDRSRPEAEQQALINAVSEELMSRFPGNTN